MTRAAAIFLCIGACIALFAGCSKNQSAQDVARTFVDRFFVEADQRAALAVTEGPAHAKVEEELRLLADQPPSDAAERPRVFYRQLGRQEQDDGVTFHFQLTVVIIGDQPVEPELIVRVRPRGGDPRDREWRVSNYEVLPPAHAHSERDGDGA